ncbi:uncharacterized protein PHACADRAFT_181983 [Phanerochaete carnosa HHB-10118-sp]|uniref:Uncharacterized protein n=1 Tax=Phanerochaete carnosa (strain HHB-10118-sp) TaxID=650164 RepID=K5WLS8_PHACS|nr:uncharacterized protein PHACADRAFT_181983 [Phanerochaete carnosa HHB-10118-sp]EKM60144.1 hypothetical protein PHACADRAFT_181983 [Phanerochaete carnosa HHB-10118-sp]
MSGLSLHEQLALLSSSAASIVTPYFAVGVSHAAGVHTMLTGTMIYDLTRKRSPVGFKNWVGYPCIIMYICSAAHFIVSVCYVRGDIQSVQNERTLLAHCLDTLPSCDITGLIEDNTPWLLPYLPFALTKLLIINMAISDIIVIWRAWVLWPCHRVVQTISGLLLLSTLGLLVFGAIQAPVQIISPVGLPGIIFSWVTNLWSTMLVSWKAWQHRRLMRAYMSRGRSRSRAEKALLLFVESGLLYSMLWMFVAISSCIMVGMGATSLSARPEFIGLSDFVNFIVTFCLIQFVSLYPTVTVILVRHADSYYNRTLVLASVCAPQLAAVHVHPDIDVLSADMIMPRSSFGTGAEDSVKEVVDPVLVSISLSRSVQS